MRCDVKPRWPCRYVQDLMAVPELAAWYAQEKRGPGAHKVVGGVFA